MDRQAVETALEAANVALTGRRRRAASSFAAIELRATERADQGRWEVLAAGTVGLVAIVAVLVIWLF